MPTATCERCGECLQSVVHFHHRSRGCCEVPVNFVCSYEESQTGGAAKGKTFCFDMKVCLPYGKRRLIR